MFKVSPNPLGEHTISGYCNSHNFSIYHSSYPAAVIFPKCVLWPLFFSNTFIRSSICYFSLSTCTFSFIKVSLRSNLPIFLEQLLNSPDSLLQSRTSLPSCTSLSFWLVDWYMGNLGNQGMVVCGNLDVTLVLYLASTNPFLPQAHGERDKDKPLDHTLLCMPPHWHFCFTYV